MDKTKLAELINISRVTLYNWEKTKPELMKMINFYIETTSGESKGSKLLKYFNQLDEDRQELYLTKIKLEALEKQQEKK
ncbi:TetR/AcrR family transcriptional regulator [Campylobacter sp. FMV-PI01]|uniref:TetR/AcrR family transcriptional regulator n=1 Tax=Campylobacter portucalensis TaxID=2608384 RepID=A0A6L5WJ04_9BACT|nr:TetR/AcrR family transcriptional regulator [Campylobacter portucalensis]MSN95985.1 TetR/AcrR family transcriptional regulator [Campylobacter portucalensis]